MERENTPVVFPFVELVQALGECFVAMLRPDEQPCGVSTLHSLF